MTVLTDAFIAAYLLVALFADRPVPRAIGWLRRPIDFIVDGLWLRQHWSLFAPDPATRSLRLHAIIRLASGGCIRWDPPRYTGSNVAAFRGFRRRLFEIMIATPGGAAGRRSLAAYLTRTYARPSIVTAVVFVRTESPAPAPWHFTGCDETETVLAVVDVESMDALAGAAR